MEKNIFYYVFNVILFFPNKALITMPRLKFYRNKKKKLKSILAENR